MLEVECPHWLVDAALTANSVLVATTAHYAHFLTLRLAQRFLDDSHGGRRAAVLVVCSHEEAAGHALHFLRRFSRLNPISSSGGAVDGGVVVCDVGEAAAEGWRGQWSGGGGHLLLLLPQLDDALEDSPCAARYARFLSLVQGDSGNVRIVGMSARLFSDDSLDHSRTRAILDRFQQLAGGASLRLQVTPPAHLLTPRRSHPTVLTFPNDEAENVQLRNLLATMESRARLLFSRDVCLPDLCGLRNNDFDSIFRLLSRVLSSLGVWGLGVAVKKLRVDVDKLVSLERLDGRGPPLAYLRQCLATLEAAIPTHSGRWPVSHSVRKVVDVLDAEKKSVILTASRLTAVALSCVLRCLAGPDSPLHQSETPPPQLDWMRSGHVVSSYSTDKLVMAFHGQKAQDSWFEFFSGSINVMVTCYDVFALCPSPPCGQVVFFDPPSCLQDYLTTTNNECQHVYLGGRSGDWLLARLEDYDRMLGLMRLSAVPLPDHSRVDPLHSDAVNSYCAKLPVDGYCGNWPVVTCEQTGDSRCRAHIVLPSSASVGAFHSGDEADTEAEAVASVYGVVSRALLAAGGGEGVHSRPPPPDQEEGAGLETLSKGQAGSKRRKRVYPIAFPSELSGGVPEENSQCLFYSISIALLAAPAPDCDVSTTTTTSSLGILTLSPLPPLPAFTVHTRLGEEAVDIKLEKRLVLSGDELETIELFHQYIFGDVLRIEKDALVFSPDESPSQYHVVLTTEDEDGVFIDFQMMSDILDQSQGPFKQKHPFKFDERQFSGAVVSPTYRNQESPHRMYVVKVRHDLTPLSEFPQSNLYHTYSDYFHIKYGVDVTNLTQPLLEVEYTNLRLNLLTPRTHARPAGGAQPAAPRKRQGGDGGDRRQMFVPELCYVWPVSAALWRKTVCLPSILHRLQQLLVCDAVRAQVEAEAGLVRVAQPGGGSHDRHRPPPPPLLSSQWETADHQHLACAYQEMLSSRTPSPNFSAHSVPDRLPSALHILQALTMSSSCDVTNMDRLETLGDSWLKLAVTAALFLAHPAATQGSLSHLRTLHIGNRNLFRVGKEKSIPKCMFHACFDPVSNWIPPLYKHEPLVQSEASTAPPVSFPEEWSGVETGVWNPVASTSQPAHSNDPSATNAMTYEIWSSSGPQQGPAWDTLPLHVPPNGTTPPPNGATPPSGQNGWAAGGGGGVFNLSDEMLIHFNDDVAEDFAIDANVPEHTPVVGGSEDRGPRPARSASVHQPSPYTENCLADKSVADCVEALIGCYLAQSGASAAIRVMQWLTLPVPDFKAASQPQGDVPPPETLEWLESLERELGYRFNNKLWLLRACIHPSEISLAKYGNYERLELLGDAVLDLLITREIFHDSRCFNSGALTDLRSALVNNIVFSSLSLKHRFHKYLRHCSSELSRHIELFDKFTTESSPEESVGFNDDLRWDSCHDVEVPKPLGDIFESIAGAILVDSSFDMEAVWEVYERLMRTAIDRYSEHIPLSPVRQLWELVPDAVAYHQLDDTPDHRCQVRVTVTAKGSYIGIGHTLKGAKAAAARHALDNIQRMASQISTQ